MLYNSHLVYDDGPKVLHFWMKSTEQGMLCITAKIYWLTSLPPPVSVMSAQHVTEKLVKKTGEDVYEVVSRKKKMKVGQQVVHFSMRGSRHLIINCSPLCIHPASSHFLCHADTGI